MIPQERPPGTWDLVHIGSFRSCRNEPLYNLNSRRRFSARCVEGRGNFKRCKRTKMAGTDKFIRSRFRQDRLRPTSQSERAVLSNHPDRNSKLHQVPIRLRPLPTTTPLAVLTVLRPPPFTAASLCLSRRLAEGLPPACHNAGPFAPARCALAGHCSPDSPATIRMKSSFLRSIGSPDHSQCDQARAT